MIEKTLSNAETPSGPGPATPEAQKQRIADLVGEFSIETVPVSAAELGSLAGQLEPGAPVYVGWPPGRTLDAVVDTAVRLHQLGCSPVPHIVARNLADGDDLAALLRRLCAQAGVDQVLVVGGGRASPVGEFSRALQLLETGHFEAAGIRRIGIAGYPEGHPRVAKRLLFEALRKKIAAGRRAGMDMHIVTQFGFDADAVVAWIDEVRRSVGDIPVRVGIPGPARLTSLVKYAWICGVGDSVRFLTRGAASVVKVATVWTPDKFLAALAGHPGAGPRAAIEAVHFYSFGGAPRTARWAARVGAGNFTLHRDGQGFTVPDDPRGSE